MSISNENNRVDLTASGSQTAFAYNFKIDDETEIEVYLTPTGNTSDDTADLLTLTTDYTVDGVGEDAGGNINLTAGSFPSGATAGDTVIAIRDISYDQDKTFAVGQDNAETLEESSDRLAMRVQRLSEIADRCYKTQATSQTAPSGSLAPGLDFIRTISFDQVQPELIGIFNSDYTNYRIFLQFTSSAITQGDLVLSDDSGVSYIAANYKTNNNTYKHNSGTVESYLLDSVLARLTTTTAATKIGTAIPAQIIIDVFNPAIATATMMLTSGIFSSSTNFVRVDGQIILANLSALIDSMKIGEAGITYTGTASIYGHRQS